MITILSESINLEDENSVFWELFTRNPNQVEVVKYEYQSIR